MFELFFHIEIIASLGSSLNINDKYFLNNITYLSINNLFRYTFVSKEITYETN